MTSLKGAKVIIFGGSAGIGFAVAKELVESEVQSLILIGTTKAKLDAACAELQSMRKEKDTLTVESATLDMMDEGAVQCFYSQYSDSCFDHIIITAGRSAFLGNVVENKRTVADLRVQMDYKLFNQMCAVLNGHPKVVDGGSFVLFSGVLAQRPGHGNASLSIANAAVEASVKGLANDLGFSRRIRVNCVSPGMTNTDTYAAMDTAKKEKYQQSCREKAPLHRIAAPDEVADSVLYLLSNKNVTGQVIVNDAGICNV